MPFADNNGIRIHYHVEGDGSPLVLQHGLTSDIQRWYMHGYVEDLSQNYKLVIVDARGHGKSDKPHTSDKYDGESMASDVISVLDQEEINKAHYVGYSMGGSIGFFLAKLFADRFHSLIIGGMHPYSLGSKVFDEMEVILRDGMELYVETYDPPLQGARLENMLANDNLALIAAGLGLKERSDLSGVLPDINITQTNSKKNIIFKTKNNKIWVFKSNKDLVLEESVFIDKNDVKDTKQIVIKGITKKNII